MAYCDGVTRHSKDGPARLSSYGGRNCYDVYDTKGQEYGGRSTGLIGFLWSLAGLD